MNEGKRLVLWGCRYTLNPKVMRLLTQSITLSHRSFYGTLISGRNFVSATRIRIQVLPTFPPAGRQAHTLFSLLMEMRNVSHGVGGRRTLLLGVDMQVWEPSGKAENLRGGNWHREMVFPNLIVLFQPFSCHSFLHFRFLQVHAIHLSSHHHAVLTFHMQTHLLCLEGGSGTAGTRAWPGWTSLTAAQPCPARRAEAMSQGSILAAVLGVTSSSPAMPDPLRAQLQEQLKTEAAPWLTLPFLPHPLSSVFLIIFIPGAHW